MKVFEDKSGMTAQVDRIRFITVRRGRLFFTLHILVRYEYYAQSCERKAVWGKN